jgi:hypothetical protein
MLVELGFESLEQSECVGGAARKPGEYLVGVETPHFARTRLEHDIAERDLAVCAQRHAISASRRNYGSAMKLLHHASVVVGW